MPSEISNASAAAASWWANKLNNPSFDNGDTESGLASMLAMSVARMSPDLTIDQKQRFFNVLAPEIEKNLVRAGSVSLGVDYGPDPILGDAADSSGVPTSRFPWKTHMYVYPDYVTVSVGYHGQSILVWASDEWLKNRPICGIQRYDNSKSHNTKYMGDPFQCGLLKYHNEPCDHNTPLELCTVCNARKSNWRHAKNIFDVSSNDYHEFVK